MTTCKRLTSALVLTFCALVLNAQAQTPQLNSVNLTAETDKVHVSTQGEVFDLKIEVVAESGETVFEGGQVAGQPLDWNMKDAQGRRVHAGTYSVMVSYLTQAGKPRKRIEQVLVTEAVTSDEGRERATVQAASGPSPTAAASVTGQGTLNKIAKFTGTNVVGNSIMTENAGRIVIGTAAPTHTLTLGGGPNWTSNNWLGAVALSNGSAIAWNTNSAGRRQGIGHTNGGLYFFRTSSNPATTGSPSLYDMVINDKGYVGIGTITPTNQLHVLSSASGVSAVYGESTTGRGVWGKSTGGSRGVFGESDSGEGVHGESVSGVGVAAQGVTGVTGLGTTGSGVYGESSAGGSATQAGVFGRGKAANGVGVIGEANVNSAVGVLGVTSSSKGFGLYGRNTGGGYGLYSENNVGQNRDKGGFVKAMVLVNADGTINRCYNSFLTGSAASSGNCGFVASRTFVGSYSVNFGFQVSDRFFSLVAYKSGNTEPIVANLSQATSINEVRVSSYVRDADNDINSADTSFWLIVY